MTAIQMMVILFCYCICNTYNTINTRTPTTISPFNKICALSFDDSQTTTMQILDAIERYKIHALFFLMGQNIHDDAAAAMRHSYEVVSISKLCTRTGTNPDIPHKLWTNVLC